MRRTRLAVQLVAALVLVGGAQADAPGEDSGPIIVSDPTPPPPPPKAKKPDTTFKVYWKDGLRMDTADKSFRLKVGGRIMNDFAFFDESSGIENGIIGKTDDGAEFRRARLYVAGEIYDRVIFKAQYDFEDGDASFKDVYMGLKKLPFLGTFKVGHFKEPFSLEELTSSKYITFMERSLPNAFAPGRNTGFGFFNSLLDERMTLASGIFLEADDFGESDGDNWFWSARTTGLPLFNGPDCLLHLGASLRVGDPNDNEASFDSRPEAHLANDYADTGYDPLLAGGPIPANDTAVTWGAEAAGVWGPFSMQGEYIGTHLDTAGGTGDPNFRGWYLFGSWFITGEHRTYKPSDGTFSRVKPASNFLQDKGTGALELALRFSQLDLADSGINGGELDDWTVGMNWYLNPNVRTMFNYVHGNPRQLSAGDADIFQMRFQIDF